VTDNEKDQIELLSILLYIIEANKGIPAKGDLRVIDAEGLSLKFFGHALSALYVYRGINISELKIPIINVPDPSSVDVLVRAAFESFLVFYYIFIDSENINEIDLKYYAWELAGLYERQKFPAILEENIKKLEQERKLIEKIRKKIKNNLIFQSYTEKQKNNLFTQLERSKWRTKGWAEIALSAGLSKLNSKFIYSFFCEHAHSGNLSITQVSQSSDFKVRRELMKPSMGHLNICVANMIKYYCLYFPKSQKYYSTNFKEPNTVSFWLEIGTCEIE